MKGRPRADYWKSFVHARLAAEIGDPGSLSIYGKNTAHVLLAEHLTAEYRVTATAKGRMVDGWKWKPSRPDNHWFDCLVGCAVAASMLGANLAGIEGAAPARREPISLSAIQAGRR